MADAAQHPPPSLSCAVAAIHARADGQGAGPDVTCRACGPASQGRIGNEGEDQPRDCALGSGSLETVDTPSAPPRGRVREARGTPPRSAECRANSQAVWIDVRRTTAGSVGARFGGELAKCVLRGTERAGPPLVVR